MLKNYVKLIVAILFVSNVMAQNIPSYVPKNGLVGYWPFNGNANDESGNGNNGTVNGATLTADRNGVANSAYSFTGGNSSYIALAKENYGNFNSKEINGITISMWFNSKSTSTLNSDMFDFRSADNGSLQIYLNNNKSNVVAVSNFDGASSSGIASYDANIPYQENKWNHIAVVNDYIKNVSKLYLNGVLIGQKDIILPHLYNPRLNFGSRYDRENNRCCGFNGNLDEFVLYNRALTEQEITALYTSTPVVQNIPSYVPKDGLVGWWPFNGNANDESGNGNHGTVNGATLTADRNGKASSAYSFDGVDDYIDLSDWSIGGEISISGWVKHNAYNHMSRIINLSNGQYLNSIIFANNNNTSSGYITGDCTPTTVTQNLFSLNSWDFFVLKFTSDSICSIYKNDSLFSSFPIVCNIPNVKRLNQFLGKSDFSVDGYFKGELDDIAIYNRALSDQEIKQLYTNCTKETATSNSFNSVVYTTNTPLNLTATPSGGAFNGEAVANNTFNPSKAKLGKNQVKYTFKNSTGCADSTIFTMILVDTLGNKCKETIYDTIKVKESTYDTILKINFKLTTGIKAGQQTSMNVYPNPASELLIIEANDIQALSGYKYKIVDLQGKEVYNALATTAKTEISLKTIGAKGMYILHIVDEKGVSIENKKIVLE